MADSKFIWGTGRRKEAVARVRVRPGKGAVLVNRRPFTEYFTTINQQVVVLGPLRTAEREGRYDIVVNVHGGGPTGQAGATALGIARALRTLEPDLDKILRDAGHLTRDARMKERKKYGQRGARRRFQFSKR